MKFYTNNVKKIQAQVGLDCFNKFLAEAREKAKNFGYHSVVIRPRPGCHDFKKDIEVLFYRNAKLVYAGYGRFAVHGERNYTFSEWGHPFFNRYGLNVPHTLKEAL